ncbi:hypothetical protein ACIPEN_05795 [Herbaspirillum chlorophenolicum]|uniref:Uncharacterized protein n=1 Tax=Herbaspirillum chlorophenolicum TaxID=211589 RepID=A0ABW8EXP5_9BURK
MARFYSASTLGFYDSNVHEKMPEDVKPIEEATYRNLMEGAANGKVIVPNKSGEPVAQDPAPMPKEQQEEMTIKQRQQAYALEADPLFFKYQRGEVTREDWLAAVDAVRARFPK